MDDIIECLCFDRHLETTGDVIKLQNFSVKGD